MADIHQKGTINTAKGADLDLKKVQETSINVPDFDLLSFLKHPQNKASGTASVPGRYTQVCYCVLPFGDAGGWRLRVQGHTIDTKTGTDATVELLVIDFSTTERKSERVKTIIARGYAYAINDQNIFRAFMAASVIISRIDLGQCPDVAKILKLYGLRKRV